MTDLIQSGLTLKVIRVALADQIRTRLKAPGARQTTVQSHRAGTAETPSVVLDPAATGYLSYWNTHGPTGLAMVHLDLTIDPGEGDEESMQYVLDDYLSAGEGNPSSIVDAVMWRTSLGLAGCFCMVDADGNVGINRELMIATLPVVVMINKDGAEVG